MTFKHKLSVRLALLKDLLPVVPVVALLAACEQPSLVGPPIKTNINVSKIVTVPDSITLAPGQTRQFASFGRTPDGDSVAINVTWQTVGGGLISPSGLYIADTLQGDYAVKATLIPPAAIGAPITALPAQTSVVHIDPVTQIVVVPASTSLVTGGTQQFAAYGRRSAGDSVAVSVFWSATGGTISSSGLYTAGPTPGGYVVNAIAGGLSGTATVTASSIPVDSVIVTPLDSVNLSVGSTQQFTAVVLDASRNVLTGRTVTWETSNSAVATVSPSGLVTGVSLGSATVTATSGGKKGHGNAKVANLPVASVTLSPSPATVYVGGTMQLVVTLKDANGRPLSGRTVTWTTSDGTVAAVDGTGLVTGIALGSTTVTATSEGQTGAATVTVSSVPVASVVVAPSVANILVGDSVQLTATTQDAAGAVLTGRAITWSSSNPSVAIVSATGLATAVAAGTASITATSEGKNAAAGVTVANVPVASVVISPATALVLAGATVQLAASPKDAAGNVLSGRVITWTSSAPATATVSSTGLVTGVAAGAVTITATSEGRTGSAAVTVNPIPVASVSLSPAAVSAAVGQAVQLTATPRDANGNPLSWRVVTWSTSNAAVATVTASGQATVGVVTGVAAGSATITATSEGKSATATATVTLVPVVSVALTPAAATIAVGGMQQLSAVTKDAAGNTLTGRVVTWVSSNTSVATVTSSGLVTGQLVGSATITATSEGKSGTSAITVQGSAASHAGHYVTPNGSASGDGSANSPWDLPTALSGAGGRVQAGDTIWLRGGTYNGDPTAPNPFVANLNGTAANPIIVRQYPGERATLVGTANSVATLRAFGSYTWFWGFEVIGSASWLSSGLDMSETAGGKFINLVVHDVLSVGIGAFSNTPGGEAYGNVVYNCGPYPPHGSGYAFYINNSSTSATKLIQDNIAFSTASYGYHAYAPTYGDLFNMRFDGNAAFNIGLDSRNYHAASFLLAGNTVQGIHYTNNYTYTTPMNPTWAASFARYSNPPSVDIEVRGNTFVGSVEWEAFTTAAVTNNTFFSSGFSYLSDVLSVPPSLSGWTWNGNTYYRDPKAAAWSYGLTGSATAYTLAAWKAATGFTAPESNPGSTPTGTWIFVRPNKYEAGRANIIVYNWANAATVNVDLSSVLSAGQAYKILNVQDFFGTPVVTGTYGGGTVGIPMGGISPPTPMFGPLSAPVTGPTFQAFVVRLQGS